MLIYYLQMLDTPEDGLYWIYGPVEGKILLRIAESMGVDPNPMTK